MTVLSLNKQCSRCPRVDQQEITAEEIIAKAKAGQALEDSTPMLVISVRDKAVVTYPYLCKPCVAIVAAHIESIGSTLEKVSATRTHKPTTSVVTNPTGPSTPTGEATGAEKPKKAAEAPKGAPTRPGAS